MSGTFSLFLTSGSCFFFFSFFSHRGDAQAGGGWCREGDGETKGVPQGLVGWMQR